MSESGELPDDLAVKLQGRWPSTLIELRDVLVAHFRRRQSHDETPEQASRSVVLVLAQHFGGRPVYLPRGERLLRAWRHLEIYRAHTGDNTAELAREHGITTRMVQRIVKEQREIARALREPAHRP